MEKLFAPLTLGKKLAGWLLPTDGRAGTWVRENGPYLREEENKKRKEKAFDSRAKFIYSQYIQHGSTLIFASDVYTFFLTIHFQASFFPIRGDGASADGGFFIRGKQSHA